MGVGAACALASATAAADEVSAVVDGARVPIGPQGTVVDRVEVHRTPTARYALVRAHDESLGACGAPRVTLSVWRGGVGPWVEIAHDVYDPCSAQGVARRVITRLVPRGEGPRLARMYVRLTVPSNPARDEVHEYRVVGDRWVSDMPLATLASGREEPGGASLQDVSAVTLDGALDDWSRVTPWQSLTSGARRATVWLGASGSRLRVAARVTDDGAARPAVTLRMSEPGVSSALLATDRDNSGRAWTLRCDDPDVRCARGDGEVTLEAETDIATMVHARPEVTAVSASAAVAWGDAAPTPLDPAMRMHTLRLPAPFSVLDGASPEGRARCAGSLVARLPAERFGGATDGGLTCGHRCAGGVCEHVIAQGVGVDRMQWLAAPGTDAMCVEVQGEGSDDFGRCGDPRAGAARLVGSLPSLGFHQVIAVERTRVEGGRTLRRGEVWALVTRSARWTRLWQGADTDGDVAPIRSFTRAGAHPVLCRGEVGAGSCESTGLTLMPVGAPRWTAR